MSSRNMTKSKVPKRNHGVLYNLKAINKLIEKDGPSKVVLITSANVQLRLRDIFDRFFKNMPVIIIPDGEKAKSWRSIEKLLKKFLHLGLDRQALVIAVGGGTVGDSAGFAASIYLRGIKYINVPTTLLAQVDSSHGGKTGIDFENAKNQIGSFYPAIATIIDGEAINSNGLEQIIGGLGEIIKVGLIKDKSILSLLRKESVSTLSRSKKLHKIIKKSIKAKYFYVSKDEKDKGVRQVLNFGHTIGHAIELKYKISHGRAVLIGMVKELEIAERLKLTKPYVRENLLNLYGILGIGFTDKYKADWKAVLKDKKLVGDKIVLPIVVREGVSKLVKIPLLKLKKLI